MPRMSTVTKSLRKNWLKVVLLALALGCIHYAGLFDHLFELNYEEFRWPLEVDIKRQVERLKANLPPDILPLRKTHFDWVLKVILALYLSIMLLSLFKTRFRTKVGVPQRDYFWSSW